MLLKGRNPEDKIILKNSFHSTQCVLYPYPDGSLRKQQVSYAWNKLCGHYDCDCIKPLGIRGLQNQEIQIYEDGTAKVLIRK